MQHPEEIWTALARRAGIVGCRPDFRFDPDFYARTYPGLDADDAMALQSHFRNQGRTLGHHGTYYTQLRQQVPHIDTALADLIIDPALKALIEEGHPDALHLAFELIQLGEPVDSQISDFSMRAYLEWYPDIAAARMNPLMHYLRFASVEGGRRTLADLRKNLHVGQQLLRSELPTVLICVHEMSRTGAPAVGRDLVRQASQTHNVVVATFRGGELIDQFLPHCCNVLITENPLREMPYVGTKVFQKIDFAILNSVECALFVHPLIAQGIPFAAYIHEYSDYTHPARVKTMAAFADLLVFSSEHVRDSWQGRLADLTFDTANDSTIIPQHPLIHGHVTEARRINARRTLSKVFGRDVTQARLICGAGHVQWRKGPDIFVQAAQACSDFDLDTVFVWIGDGQNHQDMGFGVWFDYHLRQAGANRKEGNLFFLPAGPLYPDVMDAADAMFLSSRLDPLPNVVFDAVRHGCRVVCFEGATGFADARYHGSDRIVRTPYADPGAAVRALLALPQKASIQEDEVSASPDYGPSLFDRIRGALRDRLAQQRNFVLGESAFDIPLLFTKSDKDQILRQREREKLFSYGRRLLWRDVEDVRATVAASGTWLHKRARVEDYRAVAADDPQVPDYAIHIHAFYLDDLPSELHDHVAFARASRILVTTDTEAKADAIRRMGADQGLTIQTQLVPNQGRDILPFLRLFGRAGLAGDDRIWCHLHQKKSLQTTSHGDVWRRFLHRILLGDKDMLSSAISCIAQPGIGLVAPLEPHFVPWDDSRRLLTTIADRFPGPMPNNPLLFPVGNMFWTRADVAREMLDLFGEDHVWPNEPIPTDGTEFHLIERLWPAVAARMDLESVFLHKSDEERV